MAEELEFKISSSLKDILGKDLITDDFIAIFELVKNSYDAYAKNVDITFNENEIIIADNGKGMSFEELKDKWLFLAYSEKKKKKDDNDDEVKNSSYRDIIQKRRHYAGAKGVGRFSSDRLGKNLSIITKGEKSNHLEKIDIDWTKFEKDQEAEFESIKVDYYQDPETEYQFPANSSSGTILVISYLRSQWDKDVITKLKKSLEKLINPFSETEDFEINIISERYKHEDFEKDLLGEYVKLERERVNGSVKNSILEILNLRTTQIEVVFTESLIETKITDRGTLIYHLREENKFSLLDNARIDLFFLNQSAKTSFTKAMGVELVNFGSVFLFKNGFRVQPYGDLGDDSWGLDQRKQQGYNRFLGTRDVFGRVDIISENYDEFKEVSSRDGGLVETLGYYQMKEAFEKIALKRLERYVAGVLWGEGFKKNNYFGNNEEAKEVAQKYRDDLIDQDKFSDQLENATSNIGSQIDFIKIIKSLATNKKVTIVDYNKDFIKDVKDKLDDYQSRFIPDLLKIAESTGDTDLQQKILSTEEQFQELKKEKEKAEKGEEKERKKRIKVEKEKEQAEQKAEKEQNRRLEEENKRLKAELEKEKALEKVKVEEKKSEEAIIAKEKTEQILALEKDKNTYLSATRKTLSSDAEELIHTIKLSIIGIDENLESILSSFKKKNEQELYGDISNIKLITNRVMKLTKLITKSNFKADEEVQKADVVQYIKEYIDNYSYVYKDKIEIKYVGDVSFVTRLSLLDLSIILDNLISNSHKANAKEILIEFKEESSNLIVLFHDSGDGLDINRFVNPKSIFELGVKSDVEGSGIGLYSVKKKIEEMYGKVSFVGNGILLKGATFKLEFS
ncbi:ATP-binding protein [Flammeovirga sp. MY04]|uniref:ATP-binding protein n=1 Tax=Flammeovirga sp. MY04 TaxID=1191459 RepID=UPI0008062A54|nr:ATP-binding protein [Flammeovirga sp. MY04]ANQ50551.1 ATP-binding protein [Flammeovirga sp. MY04]